MANATASNVRDRTRTTADFEKTGLPPGYDYGKVSASPVSMDEFAKLQATACFTEDDNQALKRAAPILVPGAEALVDSWRTIIGSQEHLARWFFGPDGKPDDAYKAAVKTRFVQWVADLCTKPFDEAWVNYQHEIGLRHTPAKKNRTDGAHTPTVVPLRYVLAFMAPVQQSIGPFLTGKGLDDQESARVQAAWSKAFLLAVTLWSRAYVEEDLW
jgi:hypothetical protein